MSTIKVFENNDCKITVEEVGDFRFITTLWDKTMELEVDRRVEEFETYGGAVDRAFDHLSEIK
jgi:hypothetical protein